RPRSARASGRGSRTARRRTPHLRGPRTGDPPGSSSPVPRSCPPSREVLGARVVQDVQRDLLPPEEQRRVRPAGQRLLGLLDGPVVLGLQQVVDELEPAGQLLAL